MERSYSIVIVAGGSGQRVGATCPKQYLEVGGKPLLCWTVERLLSAVSELTVVDVVLVVPRGDEAVVEHLLEEVNLPHGRVMIVSGGATRAESVWAGLQACKGEFVFIHDGVRPLVKRDLVMRLVERIDDNCNAVIPALTPSDAVRMMSIDVDGNIANSPVSRDRVRLIQTPQLFNLELLVKAYSSYFEELPEAFADDATIFGHYIEEAVQLCDGDRSNIKVTYPHDLELLGYWFEKEGRC